MQWIDKLNSVIKHDDDMVRDVNDTKHIHKYIRSANPYDMLLELLVAFVSGSEVYLLDADFSDTELKSLGISPDDCETIIDVSNKRIFVDTHDIAVSVTNADWKVWLFTSGTTGLPKKVCHSYNTLGRNVRYSERHKDDIWAFAYKMSHMAGIQVLMQALTNNNSLVYVFEDTGYKGLAMYASTKGALEAFSKGTAREWGSRGIRSNVVAPGFMETAISAKLTDEQRSKIYKRTSLKKATDVDSVAELAVFLMTDKARSITGTTLHVDNGTI